MAGARNIGCLLRANQVLPCLLQEVAEESCKDCRWAALFTSGPLALDFENSLRPAVVSAVHILQHGNVSDLVKSRSMSSEVFMLGQLV
jgi:hypothetical protein